MLEEVGVPMKRLLFVAVGNAVATAFVALACIEGSFASAAIPKSASPAVILRNTSFEFPGAGERNNNRSIGDFCCTGETATVRANDGTPIGYIYFYDFDGGVNIGSRSAAARFGVLVSGVSDPARPAARVRSAIEFTAKELKRGLTRQTKAGALRYTATILDIEFLDEAHSRYWMDTIKVRVGVEEAPASE